jgi:hypothetical protein
MNDKFKATVRRALERLAIYPLASGDYVGSCYMDVLQNVGDLNCSVDEVVEFLETRSHWRFDFALITFEDQPGVVHLAFLEYPDHQVILQHNAVDGAVDMQTVYEGLMSIHAKYMAARMPITYPRVYSDPNKTKYVTYACFLDRAYAYRLMHYNDSLSIDDFPPDLRMWGSSQQLEQAQLTPNLIH